MGKKSRGEEKKEIFFFFLQRNGGPCFQCGEDGEGGGTEGGTLGRCVCVWGGKGKMNECKGMLARNIM